MNIANKNMVLSLILKNNIKQKIYLFILLLWLISPNVLFNGRDLGNILVTIVVSIGLLSWPALFAKSWRHFFLLNIIFAPIAALLSAYQVAYRGGISSGLIQSLLEVNSVELSEKTGQWGIVVLFILASLFIYILVSLKLGDRAIAFRKLHIALFFWSCVLLIYQPFISFEIYRQLGLVLDTRALRDAFPSNLAFSINDALVDLHNRKHAPKKPPPPVRALPDKPRFLYVTIVGESTRRQTFDAVAAQTGFFLNSPELVYFDDALSQANFTDASVPMMLTGATSLDAVPQRPYLIPWQNAAKCLTVAISNSNTYDFLEDAKVRDVAGDSGILHLSRYDHDLIKIIDSILVTHNKDNICITIQMVGSHADYAARYRQEFAIYPVPADEKGKMIAEYKNTVVMVQDFLRQIMKRLDSWDGIAFMAYTSDHGENLLEINGLREHLTLTPTIYEVGVPLLFYANQSFRQRFPQKWSQLRENAKLPVSNDSYLPTILDAMDIDVPAEYLKYSLLKPYAPYERHFVRPDLRQASEFELLGR